MLKQLGFPAAVLEQDLESIYAQHLLELVRASSLDAVVLLAHERVHDPDGTAREDLGSMFVPNDVVLDLAERHPEFLAGVSIHPARARCARGTGALSGARRGADEVPAELPEHRLLGSRAIVRFGNEWRRRGLPLLAHTGGENTVPVVNAALADPKLLRLPLECGVTVIAAHCATKSGLGDPDYFDDWVADAGGVSESLRRYQRDGFAESLRASARLFARRKFCRAFCTAAIFPCRCWDIGSG